MGLNIALQAMFSERINPLSVSGASAYITNESGGLNIPANLVVNAARTLLTLTPTQPFSTNTGILLVLERAARSCWELRSL